MPASLEAETSHELGRTRLFSPIEVFSVLYGKTRPQPDNKNAVSTQESSQLMTSDGSNAACDFCRTMPQGRSCPIHRQPDQPLPKMRLTYAVKSLPSACKFCLSSAGEGYGVYTNQNIPLGTWIGPYEGRRIRPTDVTPNMDTSHMWEIYEGTTFSHYIDGSDENTASWMRFIRCARHKDEQNLFAFQYNGNIYYRAFKDIPCSTELLVWYDDKYPLYMGIPLGMEVGAVYVPTTATTAQYQHNKLQGEAASQQSNRSFNAVTSPVKPQDTACYSKTATSSQLTQSTRPLRSYQDSRSLPTNPRILPPLIPTNTLQQRRASIDSLPSDQHPSTSSDMGSGISHHGNNKVPSPTSPVSEITSWQCQQCHKTFTQRVALQMHVCPSQPTNPFQCGQCSSTFNNSSELRTHVVSHTTERPFKCGFCSRTFVGATTLNNHVRTHMGQKPFSCEKCGKTFSQAMHLARHARETCEMEDDSSGMESVTPQALTT